MEVIEGVEEIQRRCEDLRLAGKTLALVPTMGFFHEGHLELMRVAKNHADVVIISIFVNPHPVRALRGFRRVSARHGRRSGQGREARGGHGFHTHGQEMYPEGFQTTVSVATWGITFAAFQTGPLPGGHNGRGQAVQHHEASHRRFRPERLSAAHHHHRMVRDLNMDIQIVGLETVREPDGLAMSSRNSYLSGVERKSGL